MSGYANRAKRPTMVPHCVYCYAVEVESALQSYLNMFTGARMLECVDWLACKGRRR
jgi:hypothetical protein